jgi:hypothetical protein
VAKVLRIQITEMQFPEYHFYGDVYDGHVSVRFWSRDVACGAAMQTDSLQTQPARLEIEHESLYNRGKRSEVCIGNLLCRLFGIQL